MDSRIVRQQALELRSRIPTRTWYQWFWGLQPIVPARSTDAAVSVAVREHFTHMLDQTEPPETFRPTEVAQMLSDKQLKALGYEKWEEVVPAVYELAFELREIGECVILRKGKVLGDEVGIEDLDGPIRIGRAG